MGRIRELVRDKPTFGYRRVTAVLRRAGVHVNHKRLYRLLLTGYGPKPQRPHDGKVITLKSDLRRCSDAFEIRCWNGDKVHVAFSLDCCDREAIAWVAANRHLDGGDIRDLMAESIERRVGAAVTPHPIEWLNDNGPQYVAAETRVFGRDSGLLIGNTPAYSPESNGMAEVFVKTFKRDFVYLGDVASADVILRQLPRWFEEYNENHPHKGLRMLSPREFRRTHLAKQICPI